MEKSIISYFGNMKDPRMKRKRLHPLENIVFITVAGVMSGCESWDDVEDYGNCKKEWLSDFLDLKNGIPSHDTFNRFFQLLAPNEFESAFVKWVQSIVGKISDDVVGIDGKSNRGSRRGSFLKSAHIVSAFANDQNIVLAQVKTDEKSNEITAIPELLEVVDIKGNTVTIDAMGTQKAIAEKIVEKQADYILALKENQKGLFDNVLSSFSLLKSTEEHTEEDFGHGRIETRKCSIITDLKYIDQRADWKNLQSIIRIDSERVIKSTGKIEQEQRYYISTHTNAQKINKSIRSHWGIENKLHWLLDVAMNEDDSTKRRGYASQNFSIINKICLNLLKKNERKMGIRRKRNVSGWDNQFLLEILKF
jgi:predicted transposase YbfD/YdcC